MENTEFSDADFARLALTASVSDDSKDETVNEHGQDYIVYTVKRGDTLWGISIRYLGSGSKYTQIFNANRATIEDPNRIYVGQRVLIPVSDLNE